MRKFIKISLLFTLIVSLVSVTPLQWCSAQESTFKISGYILDVNGNGLKGAHIVSNVPSVIQGSSSDFSGYYEIFAPQSTYDIGVMPPFDSNYLSFVESQFSVESNITKNITLTLGHKISGYVLDTEGNPVQFAQILLNGHSTGWYSQESGYYFCTATTGTYNLTVSPREGDNHFSKYFESNVVINGDVTKNIVVSNHTSTETQSPVVEPSEPEEPPASAVFYDDFNDGVAEGWIEHSASWSVVNGEYFTSVGIVEDAITTVEGVSYTDCTVETTLRFIDTAGFRSGIIFRFIDETHYYSIELGDYYDTLDMIRYTPEDPAYGYTFAQVVGDNLFQSNRDYKLKIVVTGNAFTCFIDGEQVLTGIDDTYAYGSVGLRARYSDVAFDYFAVDNVTESDIDLPEPVSEELLAWWKLDEGSGSVVSDSSGYNNHGTINGADWLDYQGDVSLNFNGKSDFVSLPSVDLRNLDAFTVSSWINSDLTEVGFIAYQGNLGEFNMGNGDLSQETQLLNLSSNYASFAVKLADYRWYGVQSSFPMAPNTWHQIVGTWERGESIKIYVDGVLAGENKSISTGRLYSPGASFPSSLGIYSQGIHNQIDYFKGQISNVMIFNSAMTPTQIDALYEVSVPVVPRPSLDVSCESASSPYSGLNIEINGKLTLSEKGMTNEPILLSYSINGGKSWQDLTMINTLSDGTYSAIWTPLVTGIYMIKAVYEGGMDSLPASATVNYSVTQDKERNVFSVNSNSTVSSLAFNSTSRTLSFSVSGPSGTTGYADVSFSKTLVPNIEEIKVLVDLNQLEHSVTATEDSWQVHFQYQHSTHNIIVDLGTNQQVAGELLENWIYYGAVIAGLAIVIITIFVWKQKRGKNETYSKGV